MEQRHARLGSDDAATLRGRFGSAAALHQYAARAHDSCDVTRLPDAHCCSSTLVLLSASTF